MPEVYRSSIVKAAGKQLGSPFGRHPSHAEQQITESGKTFTRDRSTDCDSFGSLGNTLPGTGEGPTIAARRFALMELRLGMACYRDLPAEPYHPGTAVADHRDIDEAVTRVLDVCR